MSVYRVDGFELGQAEDSADELVYAAEQEYAELRRREARRCRRREQRRRFREQYADDRVGVAGH